ncbi:MAG: fumarylacetoacetate hydrolase family protein [Balneolaceae bacterium]
MSRPIPGLAPHRLNNIFCIGLNYRLHAKEMNSAIPREPMVFLKPNSAVIFEGEPVLLPSRSSDVHHEIEMVIAVGGHGKNVTDDEVAPLIAGVAVGIDFTARDLQQKAKSQGTPWSLAKGFDTFAPVSRFIRLEDAGDLQNLQLTLNVNGEIRQQESTSDMIFTVREVIRYLSEVFTLQPGDLIYTGTPSGVGPVQSGDSLTATLGEELITLHVDVA